MEITHGILLLSFVSTFAVIHLVQAQEHEGTYVSLFVYKKKEKKRKKKDVLRKTLIISLIYTKRVSIICEDINFMDPQKVY